MAGASVEYYTEVERGGGAQPSERMLAAFARALRLSRDERDHLYRLAGRPLPAEGGVASHVHPGMLDLLDRLAGTPAMVITDLHVVLVQNRLARALVGEEGGRSGWEASLVFRWFTDPGARRLYPEADHAYHSRALVADLWAAVARRAPGDGEARGVVRALLGRSAEFGALWDRREVAVRRDDRKRIVHPSLGVVEVNCLALLSEDGRQRLLWFTPVVGTGAVEQFALLGVVGTQDLGSGRP